MNDPRSPATVADVRVQYGLQTKIVAAMRLSWEGYQQVATMRALVAADSALPAAKAFDSTLAAVGGNPDARGGGGGGGGGFGGGAAPAPTFVRVNGNLGNQINTLENGDLAPTAAMQRAYVAACTDLKTAVTTWTGINGAPLTAFNAELTHNNLKPIPAAMRTLTAPACGGP